MKVDREQLIKSLNRLYADFYGMQYEETPASPVIIAVSTVLSGVVAKLGIFDGKIICGAHAEDISMVIDAYRNLTQTGTIEGIQPKDWK
jgi:hypothetical protein